MGAAQSAESSSTAPESSGPFFSTTVANNRGETTPRHDGYSFLLDSGLPTADLVIGIEAATAWGVPLPQALFANGAITERAYAQALATALSLPLLESCDVERTVPVTSLARHHVRLLRAEAGPQTRYAIACDAGPLDGLRIVVGEITASGGTAVIVTPHQLAAAIERAERTTALRYATLALARAQPDFSASLRPAPWQALSLAVIVGLFIGGFVVAPGYTIAFLTALLALPFLSVVLVRMVALAIMLRPSKPHALSPALTDADLPTYTVMVPLLNETEVLADLIASLTRLDYPLAKLELMLVLEEADVATKAALLTMALPINLRVIVVPDAMPRTKPKALNYAMQFAHGAFIVVYDAEDRPEPDQLRKAIAAFVAGPLNLACVQARLNIYNPRQSWLARQFTIEYSALFDGILPSLDALHLPVPLGGTSNHFPRALLESIGGWDPFNVTEDADLGIRLARRGFVTQVLASTTWEEAPIDWNQWLPQRTRWLKGWYQTYIVHTRRPARLHADLGLRQSLGFHIFLGGIILSTLVHPLVYVMMLWSLLAPANLALPEVFADGWLDTIALSTLVLGYAGTIAVGMLAQHRRGHRLAWSALQMPLAWLLISFAAYRALWQLWHAPYLWEKTAHGRASGRKPHDRTGKPP